MKTHEQGERRQMPDTLIDRLSSTDVDVVLVAALQAANELERRQAAIDRLAASIGALVAKLESAEAENERLMKLLAMPFDGALVRLQSENERLQAEYREMALGRGAAHAVRKTAVEHAERAEERALKAEAEVERLKARWHMRQANCTLNGDMACGELKDTRVMLEVAIEQRRAAEAERDKALEDAKRYRWMREADDVPLLRGDCDLLTGAELDDAIDARLLSEKQ